MTSALQHVPWEKCLVEPRPDRALEIYSRRKQGITQPGITCFSPVPWLAHGLVDLHAEHGLLMHLDQTTADLIVLVVSQENSCRYCYFAARALLWSQGMSRTRIQRVEQDLTRADLPPRTIAALNFARSQSRVGPAAARAALEALQHAGGSIDEAKEAAFVAGMTDFSNRSHTITAIPARILEQLPEQLHTRLLRPLIGWMFKRHRYRGQATPLNSTPSYPLGAIVKAYAGSPMALVLAQILEGMWASPHLTRRCKLLIFAVVARGLGCEVSAHEMSEALRAQGLGEQTVHHILTHLDAPELDPRERLLVPFARDTIWYETEFIQKRARALRESLDDAPLLEAIGVAALANGLCRINAIVARSA